MDFLLEEELLKNPDFEVRLDYCDFFVRDFADVIRLTITGIEDIGYSDKVVFLVQRMQLLQRCQGLHSEHLQS